MSRLQRFRPRYVALLHEDTSAYLSVRLPPHAQALQPTALTNELSIHSVFALIKPPRSAYPAASTSAAAGRGGAALGPPRGQRGRVPSRSGGYPIKRPYDAHLISLGVSAYLTLCPAHPAGDTGAQQASYMGAGDHLEGATLCAGFRPEKKWAEPLKLLRRPSAPAAPGAIFSFSAAA